MWMDDQKKRKGIKAELTKREVVLADGKPVLRGLGEMLDEVLRDFIGRLPKAMGN